MTAGICFYTDNRLDPVIAETVQTQLARAAGNRPIVSVSLQPLAFGRNISLPMTRSVTAMFTQILMGLEALDTDVAYLCEHDCLYAAEQFAFTPARDDTYYYNVNRWQLRTRDGFAVHYPAKQVSGCCASRALLIRHYRARLAYLAEYGWSRELGYEPGTNKFQQAFETGGSETWFSAIPRVDIRHEANLSASKWSRADFRNKSHAEGWIEANVIPGWGLTRGRVQAFFADVRAGRAPEQVAA